MIRLRINSLIQGYGLHIEIIKDWGDTMVYVTVKQSPRFHQLSIEELLFGEDKGSFSINPGIVSTVTYEREILSDKILKTANISRLIALLRDFNAKNDGLRMVDRKTLYSTFYIPKKSGGVRKINAPNSELMSALRDLKFLFEIRLYWEMKKGTMQADPSSTTAVSSRLKNRAEPGQKSRMNNVVQSTPMMLRAEWAMCPVR